MKFSTETFTQQIKNLQDLNREIRLKLSYMPSYTEQEMQNLVQLSGEMRVLALRLEQDSLLVYQHLDLLLKELQQKLEQDASKD